MTKEINILYHDFGIGKRDAKNFVDVLLWGNSCIVIKLKYT